MTFWDAYAPFYGLLRHYEPYREMHERIATLAQKHGCKCVLDFGSGTGMLQPHLAARGIGWHFCESSHGMLFGCCREWALESPDSVVACNVLYTMSPATVDAFLNIPDGAILILCEPTFWPSCWEMLRDHRQRYGLWRTLKAAPWLLPLVPFQWIIRRRWAKLRQSNEWTMMLCDSGFELLSVERTYACDSNVLIVARKK